MVTEVPVADDQLLPPFTGGLSSAGGCIPLRLDLLCFGGSLEKVPSVQLIQAYQSTEQWQAPLAYEDFRGSATDIAIEQGRPCEATALRGAKAKQELPLDSGILRPAPLPFPQNRRINYAAL